ncbi:MAG: hypothetical protein ABIH87_02290 [bacterium]
MSTFEQQQEKNLRRGLVESQELGFEGRESKEQQEDKEMGAKERIEQTVVEVKNTKQRMKNIMVNMQQVIQAVRAIRQQLGLDETGDVPAVEKDQKTLEQLKEKLAGLEDQMDDLKLALKNEEVAQLRRSNPGMDDDQLEAMADERVRQILDQMGIGYTDSV